MDYVPAFSPREIPANIPMTGPPKTYGDMRISSYPCLSDKVTLFKSGRGGNKFVPTKLFNIFDIPAALNTSDKTATCETLTNNVSIVICSH